MDNELQNPWDDLSQEEWDELSDGEKQEQIVECRGWEHFDPEIRLVNIAKYAHTSVDELRDYIVREWFQRASEEIGTILIDENEEHADPNKAAAEACIELAADLEQSVDGLVKFLLEKKGG